MNRLKTLSLACVFFGVVFPFSDRIVSQSVSVPDLNVQSFSPYWQQQLQGSYSVANSMQDVTHWDSFILQSYSILQSEWQAQVQAQIQAAVAGINTQDSFQSVQDYKNYVYDSMESQAAAFLSTWQVAAEASIEAQRNTFIDTYYSGNAAQVANLKSQFDQQFADLINGNSPTLGSGSNSDTSFLTNAQNSLLQLEQQWYAQFNSNLSNGLWNYEQALQSLTSNYQDLLTQINNTEAQYQANLAQIQSYQNNIKEQVKSTMDGYQQFLNGNDLFWNSVSTLYDTTSNAYVVPTCSSGNCTDYTYDSTTHQFVSSCSSGDTCVQLRYDNVNHTYLNPSCPTNHDCSANSSHPTVSIHTSLNTDGQTFQNLINSIENAIINGKSTYAIFDQTTAEMLSYPQSCLSDSSNCVIGWYDNTQSKFLTSSNCPSGDVCYQAIVDATNSSSLTGMYYSNSCPTGDTSCVVCPSTSTSQDTCQIQSMDASLVYAATAMSNFLQNEQVIAQNQVTAYQTGLIPQNHTIDTSISVADLLLGYNTGAAGLAMEVIGLLTGQVTSEEFANWIMNAYSAGLVGSCNYASPDSDPACLLSSISGLSPGTTITSVSTVGTDLIAYNSDGSTCHDWAGCSPFPFTINTVTLFITADPWFVGEAYGQKFSENHTWGQADGNFYNYTEIQNWGVFGIYYGAAPVLSQEDRIEVTTSYTTVDNNAHADATTWQDLNLQLQSFSYNWAQNVLPAILNWTGQVSSFEAQYAAWQQTETSLLAQAQQDYIAQLQQLQSSQTAWLAQMNALQKEANSDFTTANNKLRDGQDQSNAGSLAQEILGNLRLHGNSSGKEISESATLDSSGLFSSLISKIDAIDPNSGLPNFGLLASFSNSFQSAVSGATNLTLLSSTNNALLNSRASYMQQLADSLANERTFTQNGQSDLLRQHGDYSTKEVEGKTYLINANGNFVHCDANGANCSACLGGVSAADCGSGGATEFGNYVTSICGQNLDSSACSNYTTLKYSNVHVDENGDLVADEKIYNGRASLCQNGNATNAGDYCFQQTSEHLTIKAPSAFGLGFGGASLGNVFDSSSEAGDRISAAIGRSFASMNDFFVNNGYTSAIMADLRAADMHNNMNAVLASNSAAQQAQNANFVADFVSMVLFGGASTQEFMAHEAHQFVQNAITTFLVKTFDMSPEVAAFLSGGLLDHMAYKEAQHTLNHNGLNFMKENLGIAGGDLIYKIAGGLFYKDDLEALSQWKDDRYQVYGLAVTEYGKSQNWDAQTIQLASQLAVDYLRQRDAKMELGMRGSMFSISRLEGMINSLSASIEGPIMEGIEFAVETEARILRNAHVISKREEKELGEDLRYVTNSIKLKDDKDAIKIWKEDQAQTAVFAVGQYGKQHGWTEAEIGQMQRFAYDYVKNKQADREFGETSSLFSLGRVEGQLKLVASDVGGMEAEALGAVAKLAGEGLRDLHLITNADEKRLDVSLRQNIDATKMREYKDAQKVWHDDKAELAKTEVSIYGHANGWSDAQIAQISDLVGNYVVRQQAKADLRRLQETQNVLGLGFGTALLYLDRQAFKGALMKMTTQLGRGVLTTVADIFRETGLLSKEDTKYFYKQTKDWSDDVSGSAFEAKTHQGSIDKHWFKEQQRELVFDVISKMIDPNGPPEQQEMLSQVLKAYFDQKEQKKQAREAREQQAEMAVELAASVLITAGSGGAGSGILMDILASAGEFLGFTKNVQTAAEVAAYVDQLVTVAEGIQYGAAAVTIGAQTYFGYQDGGTNGAVAGFLNGVLSVATALKEWPVTGYVSWTPHQNGDILLGEDAQAGGWGGGLTGTLGNVNGGVSFAPGSGIDLNINYNFDGTGRAFKQGTFIGFDYSAANGGYSVNGGYDFNPNGNHHIGLSGSASSTGSSSIGAFYNYSNGVKSHAGNGLGGTLNYSNDGTIRGSAQYRGADTWSLSYNTETHKFGKIEANENFQRDYNNSIAQEHAGEHRSAALEPIITGVAEHLVENGVMSREQVNKYLQEGHGEQLLQKYQEHKAEVVSQKDGVEKFKAEIQKTSEALAKIGMEGTPNEAVLGNKSAEGMFEKIWSNIKGEAKLVFGMSDTGQIRVNEKGQLEFDTCFVAGTLIRTKDGYTAIDKLKVGDYVLSHNEKTGILSYNKITETFIHDVPAIYKITYTNGTEVETTWNHPFYIKGEGWTKAKFLSPEQRSVTVSSIRNAAILREMSSSPQMGISLAALSNEATATPWNDLYEGTAGIAKIERVIRPEKVYNIEVEGDHSYFVTRAGLLVHNYPPAIEKLAEPVRKLVTELREANRKVSFTDAIVEDPKLTEKINELDRKITHFDSTGKSLEKEKTALQTKVNEAKSKIANNGLLLSIVNSPESNNLSGIKEIRAALKGARADQGFTADQIKALDKWVKGDLTNDSVARAGLINGAKIGFNSGMTVTAAGGLQKDKTTAMSHGLAIQAARGVYGTEETARANKTIKDTAPLIAEKERQISERGIALAKSLADGKTDLENYVKDHLLGNEKFSRVASEMDAVKNASQLKRFDSPASYIIEKGKALHESTVNEFNKLAKNGYLSEKDRVQYDLALKNLDNVLQGEENRIKIAQEKASKDPAYIEALKVTKKFPEEYRKVEQVSKTNADELTRLQTSMSAKEFKDSPEVKNLQKAKSEADASMKALRTANDLAGKKMETLMNEHIKSIPSLASYGPEIYKKVTDKLSDNKLYNENLAKIEALTKSRDQEMLGMKLTTLCPGCVDSKGINTQIETLKAQNSAIYESHRKQAEKEFVEMTTFLNKKQADGRVPLDRFLNAQAEMIANLKQDILKKNFDPVTRRFIGPLENYNVDPKESQVGAQILDRAGHINEGNPKTSVREGGMPFRSEVDTVINRRLQEGVPAGFKGSESAYKRAMENLFAAPDKIFAQDTSKMTADQKKEYVHKKLDALSKMLDPKIVNQSQNGPMAHQAAALVDVIRSMGESGYTIDPQAPNAAEAQKIKDWIFAKDPKSGKYVDSLKLGNDMASAVCKIFSNYAQGTGSNKTTLKFGEYLIHKFRNGDVSFGGNRNAAPVLDVGGTAGYDTQITTTYERPGESTRNDFPTMTVGPDGKMQNIANPLSVHEIYRNLDNMQDGAIVQLYWDTNENFGPNHYSLIMKVDGEWYNLNNNDSRNADGSPKPIELTPPKLGTKDKDRPVYGIYFNGSDSIKKGSEGKEPQ